MKLNITPRGILILKGAPRHKNEFLIRSSKDVIKIDRTDENYWESDGPVKDGYYVYVETDLEDITAETDVIDFDPDADPSETELFTIINLRNCLLDYEKKLVGETLCNCAPNSNTVCNESSDKQMADFLLATVFVIENLLCEYRYNEAADIVEKVHSCNGVCQKNIKSSKKCNC
jgi:hypothetical protein